MPSLSDIRRRIGSVKNTRKITRAMKLVASAKLKRAKDAAMAAQPYQQTLQRVLGRVVTAVDDVQHPLLNTPSSDNNILVVYIATDRGLCGGFNNQLQKHTLRQIRQLEAAGKTVHLAVFGKKGNGFFKARELHIQDSTVDITPEQFDQLSTDLTDRLAREFGDGTYDRVYLAYSTFVSTMTQTPGFHQILPMTLQDSDDDAAGGGGDYLFEPEAQGILDDLLPRALRTTLFQAFLDKEAGEQAARMQAMDSATRNAGDLIDKLTLKYNRARQAAITKELIEIISGAQAL